MQYCVATRNYLRSYGVYVALVGGMICICVWLVRLRCTMEATVSPKLDFMYSVGSDRVLRCTVRCCCGRLSAWCLRPHGCSVT